MTAIEVIVALIVGVVGAAAGYFVGTTTGKRPPKHRSAAPKPRRPAW